MPYSCEFTHAICRKPGAELNSGLRALDTGNPDPARFARDHADYVDTLREAGVEVTVLGPLPDHPDGVFVEDTALCLPGGVILMRPRAPSREGEVAHIAPALRAIYGEAVSAITAPGRIEGGDILTTEREVLVGLSARTDASGIELLRQGLNRLGHTLRVVGTPPGVLHFKTDCSLLDPETVLATRRLSHTGCFAGYRVLNTAEGEDAAANAIRVNRLVLMAAGHPRTAELLMRQGYDVRQIGNTEAAKLDGGMSCLSLRLTEPPLPTQRPTENAAPIPERR